MRIVKNGDIHVSAPIGISKKEVEAFISQHQEWIVDARKKTAERQKQRADFYDQLPLTTRAQKVEEKKPVEEKPTKKEEKKAPAKPKANTKETKKK